MDTFEKCQCPVLVDLEFCTVLSSSFPMLNPSDFALIEDAQSLPGKKQKVKRLLFKGHERLARSVVVAVETMRETC